MHCELTKYKSTGKENRKATPSAMELKLIQESKANISSKYNYVLTNCRTCHE